MQVEHDWGHGIQKVPLREYPDKHEKHCEDEQFAQFAEQLKQELFSKKYPVSHFEHSSREEHSKQLTEQGKHEVLLK